jgi:hypothetical protein
MALICYKILKMSTSNVQYVLIIKVTGLATNVEIVEIAAEIAPLLHPGCRRQVFLTGTELHCPRYSAR